MKQKKLIFNFFVNRNRKKLTDSRKRAKSLADNRKSDHPIETLLSDLKGITQVQTQRRRLISVSNFTRRLAENPHRTTEAYLLIFFSSFPALFPSILFLKCCCFFFFQIVRCCSVNCVVSSWSSWGSCNARCESNGQQRRSRRVTTAASCRGTPCPTLTQTKSCRGPCCRRDCQVQLVRRW